MFKRFTFIVLLTIGIEVHAAANQTESAMTKIFECLSISAILQDLPADLSRVLIVFDVDNTLIKPQGWIGGSGWFEHLLHEKVSAGMAHQEAYSFIVQLCVQLQPYLTWVLVEPETVNIVHQLQRAGASVIAMTGRSAEQAELTHIQLKELGLSFAESCPSVILVDSWYALHEGVIFSSFYEKGKVLTDFLSKMGAPITAVICVDDMLRNVQSIERELTKQRPDLSYIGVRYAHLDAHMATFNPAEADAEFKTTMAKMTTKSVENK